MGGKKMITKIKIKIKDDHTLQFVKVEPDRKVEKKEKHSLDAEKESGRSERNSGSWYITSGNPTCYFNLDLGDGTTLQIPYPC
jgi:hypothetical protein